MDEPVRVLSSKGDLPILLTLTSAMSTQDKLEWIDNFFADMLQIAKSELSAPWTERSSDGTNSHLDFTKEQHKVSEEAFKAEQAAADAKLESAAISTQRGVKRAVEYDLSDELYTSVGDPPEDGDVLQSDPLNGFTFNKMSAARAKDLDWHR